jgi:hypothetical protein
VLVLTPNQIPNCIKIINKQHCTLQQTVFHPSLRVKDHSLYPFFPFPLILPFFSIFPTPASHSHPSPTPPHVPLGPLSSFPRRDSRRRVVPPTQCAQAGSEGEIPYVSVGVPFSQRRPCRAPSLNIVGRTDPAVVCANRPAPFALGGVCGGQVCGVRLLCGQEGDVIYGVWVGGGPCFYVLCVKTIS